MKRRDFLQYAVPFTTLPLMLNGLPMKAYGSSPLLDALMGGDTETDRVFVLIQLNGGNDGLNTIIPLDQYSKLAKSRGNILIPENKVLKLTTTTGLHPAMTELHAMYNNGKVNIVQGVGYETPNYSHFRSSDIWLTASDYNQTLNSGWLGRYLDTEYPGFPTGYPNATNPDPIALQVGSVVSTGLQGPIANMGMAISSTKSFYQLVTGGVDEAPNTPAGHELTYIRQVTTQTQQYSISIKNAAEKAKNLSGLYPPANENRLADQLKIVAQLVAGGLKTRVYVVNMGGFDTHDAQVSLTGGNETGSHAQLLGQLSEAIYAFMDDLKLLGVQDRVVGMTFSEFGRRIKSNDSRGTDHGSAAPMIVFGNQVIPGFVGTNPEVPDNATYQDNLPMQYDFRSVYASILKDWMGVKEEILQTILLKDFQTLPIIKPPVEPIGITSNEQERLILHQNYPNPSVGNTTIKFSITGGYVTINLFDRTGKKISSIVDGAYSPGTHEVNFTTNELSPGLYYYNVSSG